MGRQIIIPQIKLKNIKLQQALVSNLSEIEMPYQISTRRTNEGDFDNVEIPLTSVTVAPVAATTYKSVAPIITTIA